jgi:glycosyltransferase involved in cell wall biosynthesis
VATEPRLRVGVPRALVDVAPRSGHGNVWVQVLARLRHRCDILTDGTSGRRSLPWNRRPPDVWLSDAHQGCFGDGGIRVVHAYEAGWGTPELGALLEPAFLEAIDRMTGDGVRTATATIVPSTSTRRQLVERYGIDPDTVHVVPLGVDIETFRPDAAGGGAVLRRAGAADRPYVLFASQLHPRKNLGVLREAMVRLADRGFPHGLVVVGDPPADRIDGQTIVDDLVAPLPGAPGRLVRVVAPTDAELAALMAGADALCLPSLMEGFGLTPLEALACGTPVVVSDRGSLPEVVGDVGIVVAPTAEAVEQGIAEVLGLTDHARADLAVRARRHAEQFTWDRTAGGWLAVLERAVQAVRA